MSSLDFNDVLSENKGHMVSIKLVEYLPFANRFKNLPIPCLFCSAWCIGFGPLEINRPKYRFQKQ